MSDETQLETEVVIDIPADVMVAIIRALDAYAMGVRHAQEDPKFDMADRQLRRQTKGLPSPLDIGCEAFLDSLMCSGFALLALQRLELPE